MDVIWTIFAALGAVAVTILVGAMSRQASDEFKAWTPWLTRHLLYRAVKKMPLDMAERYNEEWASHIAETPGEVGKLIAAIGFVFAARSMSRASRLITLRTIFLRPLESDRKLVSELVSIVYRKDDQPLSAEASLLVKRFAESKISYSDIFLLRWCQLRDWMKKSGSDTVDSWPNAWTHQKSGAFSRCGLPQRSRCLRPNLPHRFGLSKLNCACNGIRSFLLASGGRDKAEDVMSEDTEFGRELIASMQEALAIVRGEAEPARVHLPPGSVDVRAIREKLCLSRQAFCERFGLAVAAVRDWEQGLRRPDPAARVLLMVISRSPDMVAKVVAEAQVA